MKTIVILRCGETDCALEREAVREITPMPDLAHPPSLPASVEGILNLGGEAIVVVALERLLGVVRDDDVDPLYRHIVILGGAGAGVALLVDRVEDVRSVDESVAIEAVTVSSVNECVVGQLTVNERTVYLLDAGRIFLAAEMARFSDIRLAEQARLDALLTS